MINLEKAVEGGDAIMIKNDNRFSFFFLGILGLILIEYVNGIIFQTLEVMVVYLNRLNVFVTRDVMQLPVSVPQI